MSAGNAHIGKPAPAFKATAVVDGQFKDIQLSDYKGNFCYLTLSTSLVNDQVFAHLVQILGVIKY